MPHHTFLILEPKCPAIYQGCYDWPGNVRQLQNVVRSALLRRHGDTIEPHDLHLPTRNGEQDARDLEAQVADYTSELLKKFLAQYRNHVPAAAKAAGISERTFYRKLRHPHPPVPTACGRATG